MVKKSPAETASTLPESDLPMSETPISEPTVTPTEPADFDDTYAEASVVQDGDEDAPVRSVRAISMKAFLPPEGQSWINKTIVSQGKGFQKMLGRMYGMAARTERKVNDHQGKQLTSVSLIGAFECVVFETGEVISASQVYLPMAFAEQVEASLSLDGVSNVQIDVDVGIEATGKTIPYEWVIYSHLAGAAQKALRRLRARRVTALAPAAVKRIAG